MTSQVRQRLQKSTLPIMDKNTQLLILSRGRWGWVWGWAYINPAGGANIQQFIWAYPITVLDSETGRTCSISGYWFPGRLIVYVDGLPYGLPFAPDPLKLVRPKV